MKMFKVNKPHVRNTKYASICNADRSKKNFVLFAIFAALILACSLLLINAQANADANGATGGQSNEPSVTATAVWDVDGETTLEGTDATLTIATTSDAVPVTSADADILYLADWGCSGDVGYLQLINDSIARIKAQNNGSRFGFIGFSEGVSITSDGFTADYQLKNYVFGTFSDWSLGFDKAAEMIDKRSVTSRPVEIIFLTNHADATRNISKTIASYDALAQKCSSFKIVSPNNAASTSILKDKVSEDNLYDGDTLNLVTKGLVDKTYLDWSHALSQANSDRVNKPIKNVSISTTLKNGFDIKKDGNLDEIYIGEHRVTNETSGSDIKITSTKFTSGESVQITIKLKFNGVRQENIPCTDTTTYVLTPASAANQTLTAEPVNLKMVVRHVTYDIDSGTGQEAPTDTKDYFKGDTVYAKDGSLLVKDDSNFGGWEASSEKGDHQVVGNAGMQFTMGSSDLTLQAQYCKLFVYKEGYTASESAYTVKNNGKNGIILDSSIAKTSVTKIVFTNSIDNIPPRATTWNASEGGLAGIKAWAEKNNENSDSNDDTYTVYYGCDNRYPALPNTCNNIFKDFKNLQAIEGLENINTSNVTSMNSMFCNCSTLKSIDLSKLNTSNVTDMEFMFSHCEALTNLDLSNFNTEKVALMDRMFSNCVSLNSLDLSSFNTKAVTDMCYMFFLCKNIENLDLSNFDTSSVKSIFSMFDDCYALKSLNLSNFVTTSITGDKGMKCMFYNCKSLTTLDISSFNTSSVTNMEQMFGSCELLENLNVTNFDTKNVEKMDYMFYGCSKLTSLDVSNFDTSKVTDMSYMFYGCSGLTSLDVTKFNTSKVTNMYYMFYGCSNLTSLDLSTFNTSNVTNMAYMFQNCKKLSNLNVSNFNTEKVTDMSYMFLSCEALTNFSLTNFNTALVTNMKGMFQDCKNLTKLDLSSFKFAESITMTNMMYHAFFNCTSSSKGEVKIRSDMVTKFKDNSGIDTSKVTITPVESVDLNDSENANDGMLNSPNKTVDTFIEEVNATNTDEYAQATDEVSAPDESSSSEENTTNTNDSGIQKAYGDEIDSSNQEGTNSSYGSVPGQYSQTVNAGTFSSTVKEITFSLKAINYGNYGTSGKITVTDTIPSGLKYVEGSINSYAVRRLSADSGGLDGGFVDGQEPAYADGKITFAVEGLSAGAQLEVTFKCELESTPGGYTQFVNFASYETKQFSGASNYATATYGTKPSTNVYANTFANAGDNIPPNAPKYATLSYAAGATVTLPDIPEIAGYSATRKVTDASSKEITVATDNTFKMPASNVTTTITWTKLDTSTHKVTFTFGNDESKYPTAAKSLLPGEDNHITGTTVAVPIIAEDSYSGWKFTGWTAEAEASDEPVIIEDGQFTMPGANVTVTGTWEKNAYSINLLKGTGPAAGDVKLPEGYPKTGIVWGSTCDWPEDAEYTGTTGTKYKFNGWSASPSLTNTDGKFTMPMQDVTFTATWTPVNTFTVTYDANGHGTAPAAQTVDDGTTTTKPTDPSTTGYTFGGWYKEAACTNVWNFDTDKVVENTTLYAKWTAKSVEVTFNHNDGETPTTQKKTQTFDANYTFPADPTRAGYSFTGWYDAKEGGNEVTTETKVATEDAHTLYAHWNEKENVTITYSAATGGSADPDSESVAPATGSATGSTATADAGYHFVNWTDGAGKVISTESKYVPQKSEAGIYETATYTANFAENADVTILYSAATGGSADPDSESVAPATGSATGSTATADAGYHFVNWTDGAGKVISTESKYVPQKSEAGIYETATYTANFAENADVTILYSAATGGSVDPDSESVAPATGSATGSTATAEAGYHFVNWTDDAGEVISTESKYVPQKSEAGIYETATYTANFAENANVTISYSATTGGSVNPTSESVAPATGSATGSTATANAGYHFVNWTDGAGEVISTETQYIPQKSEAGIYETATYTANFAENEAVTIAYQATTGGSVNPESESVAPATGTAKGSTATANAGYHFLNWTDAAGKVVSTDSKFVPQKSEAGIYEAATYTANFDINKLIITFDSNGGSSVDPVEVESGQTIEKPTTTKDGFNFVNWFEKIDEETIADDPWDFSVGFTKDTTLIAKWSEITPVIEDPTAKVDEKSLDEVLKAKQQDPEYKDKALDIVFDIKQDAPEGDKEAITKYIEQNEIKSDNVEYHEAILTMFIDKDFDNPVDIGDDNNELITASYTFDFNKKENIHVIRNHEYATGTKAEELTETPNEFDEYVTFDKTNNQIIVVAKKYSAYSVSYTNITDPTPEPEPTLPNNNSVDAASTSSTGDSAPIVPVATTMLIALVACVGLRRRLTN